MKGKRIRSTGASYGVQVGCYTSGALSLRVSLSPDGVCEINRDEDYVPGQQPLWPDVFESPLVRVLPPLGQRLAGELDGVLAGKQVNLRTYWKPAKPRWQLELYQWLRVLAPGRLTTIPDEMMLGGKDREPKRIASAIRNCCLIPLVPAHRVAAVVDEPVPFPWGEIWQERLLEREREAQGPLCEVCCHQGTPRAGVGQRPNVIAGRGGHV